MNGAAGNSRLRRLIKPAARPVVQFLFNRLGPLSSSPAPVPILLYHSLDGSGSDLSLSPEKFRRQMAWLHRHGWRVLTLSGYAAALKGGTLRPPAAVITFDDGYKNFFAQARPVLDRYGFKATIFIAADFVGRSSGSFSLLDLPLLDRSELAALSGEGHEIGSHTLSHPSLPRLTADRSRREIEESKTVLEELTGEEIGSFAYPRGDYTAGIVEMVRTAGYQAAVTLRPGNRGRMEEIFTLPRVTLRPGDGLGYFRLALGPFFGRYQRLFQLPVRPR
ncbi:MAG: polysaccharide deacetylase family protein [Candidatus Erginobacter occultus]|nr:polysaccharide deacetylase family protein [Candidatus Erginobacter occultus]